MPTKPIDRLLFAQGGLCFFCNSTLPKADATVEHLLASSKGGANGDDNCVACCKAINTLLGSMSLKEKIKVVLNQKGNFKCPNGTGSKQPASATTSVSPKKVPAAKADDPLALLTKNLTARAKGRPTKISTLTADIKSQKFGLTDSGIHDLIEKLKAQGKIVITGTKVTYKL